jgi:hypothetical protein
MGTCSDTLKIFPMIQSKTEKDNTSLKAQTGRGGIEKTAEPAYRQAGGYIYHDKL